MEYSVILSVQFKEESKLIEVNSSSSFIQLQESILENEVKFSKASTSLTRDLEMTMK
ncbi:hypothetical protein ACS0TY_014668 [Phlomoides rotata]